MKSPNTTTPTNLTNFIKNQLKIFEEISKGNTVIVGRPVTNTTEDITVFDAEFNPKEFYGGKFKHLTYA